MIGELVGEVVGWVVGEIFGGVLEMIWPERVRGVVVLLAWLVIGGGVWMTTRWWQADPASDRRTQLVVLAWVFLPLIGAGLSASWDSGVERKRMRREQAGRGAPRNDRPR